MGDALNELFPIIDVENLNAELALLTGWQLGLGSTGQAALAANLNHSQLFNPATSGKIVVVERVDFRAEMNQAIEFITATAGLTTVTGNVIPRDTRQGIIAPLIAEVREVQQVGGLPATGVIVVEDLVTFTLAEKLGLFVLAPGTGITFATSIVNTGFFVNWIWRERVAQPAELNF
ncbi:MAG: hypothetical protein V3S36_09715 [Acidiferrobacterales bacterium]